MSESDDVMAELTMGMTEAQAWERLASHRELAEDVARQVRLRGISDPTDAQDIGSAYLRWGARLVAAWWYTGPVDREGHEEATWMAEAAGWDEAAGLVEDAMEEIGS